MVVEEQGFSLLRNILQPRFLWYSEEQFFFPLHDITVIDRLDFLLLKLLAYYKIDPVKRVWFPD